MIQVVDLYKPIAADRVGAPPLTIRVAVTHGNGSIAGGVPASAQRAETYVLLSAMPEELRRRIELAVQALVTGG